MPVVASRYHSNILSNLAAHLLALTTVLVAAFLLVLTQPQNALAADPVGTVFTEKITVGDEQVDCVFKVTGAGTVSVGEGGFDVWDWDNGERPLKLPAPDAKPALPQVNSDSWDIDLRQNANARGEVIIPDTITHEGSSYQVTEIADGAFCRALGITGVSIPNSVKRIGKGAFYQCTGLTSIEIPDTDSIKTIEEYCFAGCTGLANVTGGSKVTRINASAFRDCDALHSFKVPKKVHSIDAMAFYDCDGLVSVSMSDNVDSLGESVFAYDDALGLVELSNSLSTLPAYSFANCYNLSDIDISRVDVLGEQAFAYCTNLQDVQLSPGLQSIPESAFYGAGLRSLEIPVTVSNIGDCAFYACEQLATLSFDPASSCSIGDWAFEQCVFLKTLDLHGVSSLGEGSFVGCTNLQSVDAGTLNAIPSKAFKDCAGLSSVVKPTGISVVEDAFENCHVLNTTIPTYALLRADGALVECDASGNASDSAHVYDLSAPDADDGKRAITKVFVASGVTEVPENAFANCVSLTSVALPASVTEVGKNAFWGCTALRTVTGTGVTKVGESAFQDCSALETVGFMGQLAELGELSFRDCKALANVNLSPTLEYISGGAFFGCSNLSQLTLPTTTELTVGASAFQDCMALESVVFPSRIKDLDDAAFGNSGLKSVGVPTITPYSGHYSYAFQDCVHLTEVEIHGGVDVNSNNRLYLPAGYFSGCTALQEVTFLDDIEVIYSDAFRYCAALTSVDLPESVWGLGPNSFGHCTGLTSLQLPAGTLFLEAPFDHCTALSSVTVPSSVMEMREFGDVSSSLVSTFSNCTALANCTFAGNSFTRIPDCMFSNCTALASIDIPDNVSSIGAQAFEHCSVLKDVDLPQGLSYLGAYAFVSCPCLDSLAFPTNPSVGEVVFDNQGGRYDKGAQFANCYSLTELVLPENLETIPYAMAYGCYSLPKVTIPASVQEIDAWAFGDCGHLETVVFQNNCATTDFYGEDSEEDWDPDMIFAGCNSLAKVVFRDKKPAAGAVSFPSNPTFYYTLYYYPTQAAAEAGAASDRLGFVAAKAGTNMRGTSAPAASNLYLEGLLGEGWLRASSAEPAITANALSDSGWAVVYSWKGVLFTTQPVGGESTDGSFILTSEAKAVQASNGSITQLPDAVSYAWYECDSEGALLDNQPEGSTATLSLSGLSAGAHFFKCRASASSDLDQTTVWSDLARVTVMNGRLAFTDDSVQYSWPVTHSIWDEGPEVTLMNTSGVTVTGITWRSENGYVWVDGDIPDVASSASVNFELWPNVEDAEVGEYTDTLIISSDNAPTISIPVTLTFYDASQPWVDFQVDDVSVSEVDFGTLQTGYASSPAEDVYIFARNSGITFNSRNTPAYFDITNEYMDGRYPCYLYSNEGVGLTILPKLGLTAGTYEEDLVYNVIIDGQASTATLRLKVTVAGDGPTPPTPTKSFKRLAGSDRYATGAAIAGTYGAHGGTVILATGDNFPDALCASALAGKVGGPILMTSSKSLSAATRDTLAAIKPERIIVVGGTGAVPDSVLKAAYEAAGLEYDAAQAAEDRFSGANRFATGVAIYEKGELQGGDTCIIATGGNFADALSISPYAYATETPIFLADTKTLKLDAATAAAISGKFDKVIIVGGTGVVSDAVVDQIGASSSVRLAGASRYGTSIAIAEWEMGFDTDKAFWPDGAQALGASNVSLATGANFPDALTGGALCGKNNSVLLLVSEKTAEYTDALALVRANSQGIEQGYIFGGTGAVSDALKARFDAALN